MLNKQKMFDDAVKGLWGQQALSITVGGGCAYRGDKGCKCAIGYLIPDESYDVELEGKNASTKEIVEAIDHKYGKPADVPDLSFLMKLQASLHDDLDDGPFDPETFKAAALKFAQQYNLKVDVNLFEATEK